MKEKLSLKALIIFLVIILAAVCWEQEAIMPPVDYLNNNRVPRLDNWQGELFLALPHYNNSEVGFWGFQNRKTFVQWNVIIIQPNPKVWLISRKIFYSNGEVRRLLDKNFCLGITGQWYNSPYRINSYNWSLGALVEIIPFGKTCLDLRYIWEVTEGKFDKNFLVSWKIIF